MIRKNALLRRLVDVKVSSKEIYDSFMSSYCPEQEMCPRCGKIGDCSVHADYGRNLVDFIDERPVRQDIMVLRVVCGCGYTHAILPDIIIPYCSYSLIFVLKVLGEYFQGLLTVEKICERFCITASQLYKWLNLWKTQKTDWLGILGVGDTPDQSFLCSIFQTALYSEFACRFVRIFDKSFLQFHRNPGSYLQETLGG